MSVAHYDRLVRRWQKAACAYAAALRENGPAAYDALQQSAVRTALDKARDVLVAAYPKGKPQEESK